MPSPPSPTHTVSRPDVLARVEARFPIVAERLMRTHGLRLPRHVVPFVAFFLGCEAPGEKRLRDALDLSFLAGIAQWFREDPPKAYADERIHGRRRAGIPAEMLVVGECFDLEQLWGLWYDDPAALPTVVALQPSLRAEVKACAPTLLASIHARRKPHLADDQRAAWRWLEELLPLERDAHALEAIPAPSVRTGEVLRPRPISELTGALAEIARVDSGATAWARGRVYDLGASPLIPASLDGDLDAVARALDGAEVDDAVLRHAACCTESLDVLEVLLARVPSARGEVLRSWIGRATHQPPDGGVRRRAIDVALARWIATEPRRVEPILLALAHARFDDALPSLLPRVDPGWVSEDGRPLLHAVAAAGAVDAVRALLARGADSSVRDHDGATMRETAKRLWSHDAERGSHLLKLFPDPKAVPAPVAAARGGPIAPGARVVHVKFGEGESRPSSRVPIPARRYASPTAPHASCSRAS